MDFNLQSSVHTLLSSSKILNTSLCLSRTMAIVTYIAFVLSALCLGHCCVWRKDRLQYVQVQENAAATPSPRAVSCL